MYNILENIKKTYQRFIDIFKGLEPKQILELSKQADKMRTENQEREREERQRKKEQSKGFTR